MSTTSPEGSIDGIAPGIAYAFYPRKGIEGNKKYLSCNQDGTKADLWHEDDNSGRQKWILKLVGKEGNHGVYHIEVFDGVYNGKKYLSCNHKGTKVDIWHEDDNTGRQKWVFIKDGVDPVTGLNYFNIRIKSGVQDRQWLSCTHDGDKVDLYYGDDDTGRQQWIATPLDLELIDMKYLFDEKELIKLAPIIVGRQTLINNSSNEQQMQFSVSKTISKESHFEHSIGIELTVGTTFTAKLPLVGESETSISLTTSYSHTWGQSTATEDSWTQELPLVVKPSTKATAVATVKNAKLDIPYIATLKSKITGFQCQQRGIYRGTSTYDITYTVDETPLE